jgi:hypothetical protein
MGISPERIVYANPIKTAGGFAAANNTGVHQFTFDSESEIAKMATAVPGGTVLLRIRMDNTKSLIDLMTFNSVSAEEIQKVVSQKGYYPKDTPVKNYDPGFIDGCLIGAWEQVFNMIVDNREIPF